MAKIELETIVKAIRDKGLTAYKIAQETSLTEAGINKILSGESKNPREETLKTLDNYLKSIAIVPQQKSPETLESNEAQKAIEYFILNFEELKNTNPLVKMFAANIRLQARIEIMTEFDRK